MKQEKDIEDRTPAQERADIGTPAGEPPIKGRTRHDTELMHPEMETDMEPVRRGVIEDESDDEMDIEDFSVDGEEISTTGGITGTHVHGGIPSGGSQQGGTPVGPDEMRSGDYKKNRG
jgi:hypothetical protein